MPLMSANETGHWDFRTDNVYFYMTQMVNTAFAAQ